MPFNPVGPPSRFLASLGMGWEGRELGRVSFHSPPSQPSPLPLIPAFKNRCRPRGESGDGWGRGRSGRGRGRAGAGLGPRGVGSLALGPYPSKSFHLSRPGFLPQETGVVVWASQACRERGSGLKLSGEAGIAGKPAPCSGVRPSVGQKGADTVASAGNTGGGA